MKAVKFIVIPVLVVAIIACLFIPFFSAGAEEPFVIACFSDPHHDYGVADAEPFVRPSSQKAVEYVNTITKGGADLVMIGGDITGRYTTWTDEGIKNLMDASYSLFAGAAKGGKALVATGNHDCEPTVHSDTLEINSNDYTKYIEKAMGKPKAEFYSSDISEDHAFPFDEQLCFRYEVNGFEVLGLNTPQGDRRSIKQVGHNGLYIEQVDWLEKQLKSIGKDETVFLMCHYSPDTIHTVTSLLDPVDETVYNACRVKMKELMEEYSNVIYLYGHVHTEAVQALASTEESVQPFSDNENSALACHMGSLGYYKDFYNPGNLGAEDPKVVQVMMIYVYSDRIVFAEHNTGEMPANSGDYELEEYTVERNLADNFSKKVSLFQKIFG